MNFKITIINSIYYYIFISWIFFKVTDNPQKHSLLNILKHFLRIDTKESISNIIWKTTENLVHRATLIESQEDSERLLCTQNIQKITCPHCKFDVSSSRKLSFPHSNLPLITTFSSIQGSHNGIMPSQSSVSLSLQNDNNSNIFCSVPPPPPPPPLAAYVSSKNLSQNIPIPPIFPSKSNHSDERIDTSKIPEIHTKSLKPLPQQEIPTPRAKMKTINWNKIPPNKVIGKKNIWSVVANNHQNDPITGLNWDEMEGLFCQQISLSSPKLGRENNRSDAIENRRSRKEEVENLIIYLKFKIL